MEHFNKIIDRSGQFSAKYDELKMKFGREDAYSMWVADMDFEVAPAISEAIEKRAKQHIYGYTTRPDSYYESMIKWYARRYGFEINKEWLIHSPGVVTSLGVVVKELTKPEDKIIIQPPVYYPFFDSVLLNGRTLLKNPLIKDGDDYKIDFDGLEALAKEASFLILCNPHNPVGRVWSREELERLSEICLRNNVRVIADEIHGDLVYSGKKYTPFASLSDPVADMTITCLSATKSFNIAGLQASFMLVPRREEYEKVDALFTILDLKRNNCFSQVAVEAAYSDGEAWLESMIDYVKGNMDYVREYCQEHIPQLIPNEPEGTYLIWMDCRELGLNDEDLSHFMINEAKIALNGGIAFGEEGAGYVRLNLACPRSVVIEAMQSLNEAVQTIITKEVCNESA